MQDNEVLQIILSELKELKQGQQKTNERLDAMQDDIHTLKGDVEVLKGDVKGLKEDVEVLKEDVKELKEDVEIIKEDAEITRTATNVLLEWAEKAQTPLHIPLTR